MTLENTIQYKVDFDALDEQMANLNIDSDTSDIVFKTIKDQISDPNTEREDFLIQTFNKTFEIEGPQTIFTIGPNDKIDSSLNIESVTPTDKPELNKISDKANHQISPRTLYYLFRKIPTRIEDTMEIRISVLGNVDAGKSTILGVLTRNILDNGRGSARSAVFRHKHEIDSGRTSSIGMEIMGFDKESSEVITGDQNRTLPWPEIASRSSKIVAFHDLAGHEKYLRTTVFGLTGGLPEAVMLVVGANAGMIGMAKEHLGLTLALKLPVFIVVTKVDMCPANVLEATIKQLFKLLKSNGCRKVPLYIKSTKDVIEAATLHSGSDRTCPVFLVSNVSGNGLDLLRNYINFYPQSNKYNRNKPAIMEIRESYSVPFVGTVVSGVVWQGSVHSGDQFWIGPNEFGQFTTTVIKSIHNNRSPVSVSFAGQSASFALKKVARKDVRKGLVLISKGTDVNEEMPKAYYCFEADVLILYHSTTIDLKYQAVLHCRAIRQTARIVSICDQEDTLRTGDRAKVVFRFLVRPEYLTVGSKIIFREGRTKGVGKITRLLSPEEEREIMKHNISQKNK
ncbi:GTP-binding protein 1 [Smittium culicis]|uniref:GTP-binding protein 1 n=1 Tax=Smittium culicis TaxID=133412 RepID=A0A1R1XYF8_9FUNG|nr:GTP-binding protein 1 [Smittium culicis]OMJ19645.1 GTP-binding protein 1 [Smittium culicis]